MALPTSPSVVVLENDVSTYAPEVNSSVVGIVGFADKGPVDKATLITNQASLVKTFGKPKSSIPGQGLEGALEILEATNQVYFVRAADSATRAQATGNIPLGVCPSVQIDWTAADGLVFAYSAIDNNGTTQVTGSVTLPVTSTSFSTKEAVLFNSFNPDIYEDQPVFAGVDGANLFLAGRYAGSSTQLIVSAAAGSPFTQVSSNGNTTGGAGNVITANGYTISDASISAFSLNPGAGYNYSVDRDGTVGITVEVANKSVKDLITVNVDGAAEETHLGSLVTSADDFFEYLLQDNTILSKSDYVYLNAVDAGNDYTGFPNVISDKLGDAVDVNGATNVTPRFVKPIAGTYTFAGGNSGYGTADASDQAQSAAETAMIGNAAQKTGIHALDDDGLNISIALAPGISDDNIQNELITLAETSKNFLALISPPYAVGTVQDAIDWLNGKGSRTAAVNSSYAAAYWPWVQVFNSYAGGEEWYDPAIFAARQCVYTDAVSDPWFAPAGVNRGRLTRPTDTEAVLNQGDRDSLYSNAINPINKDPNSGILVFGQKTTQRKPSALDRVNVRRLMIYVRKVLLQLGKPFQFEPNDQFTWTSVEAAINPFLSDLLARRAIVEGVVKCDSTTNTPLRVDRNELWCSITIKPTKTAETIVFEVNLTSQSASISG